MHVWLNGKLIERASATVPAFDAGLQHGIGLFETMSARNGHVFRVNEHAQRLVDSARVLLLSDRLRARPLAEAVQQVLERNGLADARLRLTVTGGNLNMLAQSAPAQIDLSMPARRWKVGKAAKTMSRTGPPLPRNASHSWTFKRSRRTANGWPDWETAP